LASPTDEALFHFFNLLASVEGHVLITACAAPGQLSITLPDLASRLRMLPVVDLPVPDDSALAQLTLKWLHDRQWKLSQESISTLLTMPERTPAGIQQTLALLDQRMAQFSTRPVTP